jgi:hypothetical protein
MFAFQYKVYIDESDATIPAQYCPFCRDWLPVANQVLSELLKQDLLYSLQSNIPEAEIQTAARVAKTRIRFQHGHRSSSD